MLRIPAEVASIPTDTYRVATAVFPEGNLIMRIREALGPLLATADFAALFPQLGQPALDPARLALVTVFQYLEGVSDRQAVQNVRRCIDWKYALALPLEDQGFDASVLSEFRARLLAGQAEQGLFDTVLTCLQERGLLKARGRQRTDSTHVLAAVRTLNRLACVAETLRHALNDLADIAPDWLRAQITPDWFDRYRRRVEEYRLPTDKGDRQRLAETIGHDGFTLLAALDAPTAPVGLWARPALQVLRQVWIQQYYAPSSDVHWRTAEDLPPHALLICSPYDPEARYATKRETHWTGYKVHLTETCEEEGPHLITNVETTPATTNDVELTAVIHTHLAAHDLLPHEHFVDTGYVDADHLVTSTSQGIELVGPVLADNSWQARSPEGYDLSCFAIDWAAQAVTCPHGKVSRRWTPGRDPQGSGQEVVAIQFDPADCAACPVRARCTQAKTGPRTMKLRPQAQHDALQTARHRQRTTAFKERYATRAGVEGTLSQGVRAFTLRQARYLGQAKTHLQHLLIAVAINLVRVVEWLAGTPQARTRTSSFAALTGASGCT
jgi:transposase